MKILHTLRLDRMKWRHWVLLLLLLLVTLTKMIPLWGVIYTYRIYPIIGTLLSPISGIFSFCRRRYLHCSQHRLGYLLSYLRDRIEEETRQSIFLSCCEERRLSEEEGGIRESGRISALGICLVLHAWGLNYSQPNIYYRIGMKPVEVSEAKFREFAYQYADSLNALSISEGKSV